MNRRFNCLIPYILFLGIILPLLIYSIYNDDKEILRGAKNIYVIQTKVDKISCDKVYKHEELANIKVKLDNKEFSFWKNKKGQNTKEFCSNFIKQYPIGSKVYVKLIPVHLGKVKDKILLLKLNKDIIIKYNIKDLLSTATIKVMSILDVLIIIFLIYLWNKNILCTEKHFRFSRNFRNSNLYRNIMIIMAILIILNIIFG